MAESSPDISPYTFVTDNPVSLIDPLGLDTTHHDGYGGKHTPLNDVTVGGNNGNSSPYYYGSWNDLDTHPHPISDRGQNIVDMMSDLNASRRPTSGENKSPKKPNHTHVQLLIWDVGAGKDVGHTAIRINATVYGYYPTDENNNGIFDMGELLWSKGQMHINTEAEFYQFYNGDGITFFDVNMSSAQADQLSNILNTYAKDPGHYSLAGKNCTSIAVQALINSGVSISGLPGGVMSPLTEGTYITPSQLSQVVQEQDNQNSFTNKQHYIIQ